MMSGRKRLSGAAIASCMGVALAGSAHAQARLYNGGATADHGYALLNGDLLALYINDRGDLGAPYRGKPNAPVTPEKPIGQLQPNLQPFVNNDGSVDLANGGTYGALFTRTSTAGAGNIAASVRQKFEYLTVGGTSVAEGYSIFGNDVNLHSGTNNFLTSRNLTLNSFAVQGDSVSGELSASSVLFRQTNASTGKGLQIQQDVAFQLSGDAATRNRARFTITFTNTDEKALTGLRYARGVDPNEGGSTASPTSQTTQKFRTPTEPNAFAIDSIVAADTERHLGFGVLPGDPNADGSIVLATRTTSEATLLRNPISQLATNRYVELGSGNSASFFEAGGSLLGSTTDFTTDAAFDPDFLSNSVGDIAMLLMSPTIDLQPGESKQWVFYYFFDPLNGGSPVPEPGAFALMVSGGAAGSLLLRKRRRK